MVAPLSVEVSVSCPTSFCATRTSRGDPKCWTCGEGLEDTNHLIFHCPFARACWYASQFPLRSDCLTGTFLENLCFISSAIPDEEWMGAVSVMWGIWHSRNDNAYGGSVATTKGYIKYKKSIQLEALVAQPNKGQYRDSRGNSPNINPVVEEFNCHVDRSWKDNWNGGLGFIFKKVDMLLAYKSARAIVCCPEQAEARALKETLIYARENGIAN